MYALFDDNNLLYIGKTVNLLQRYNNGYGHIEPINCYVGAQATNCRINAMVPEKYPMLTVLFDTAGERKLMVQIAHIRKLSK